MEDRISKRAYELWEEEGRPHGRDLTHWEEARRQIELEERGAAPEEGSARAAVARTKRETRGSETRSGRPTAGRKATHAEESAMPAAAPSADIPFGVPGMTASPIVPEGALPGIIPGGEPDALATPVTVSGEEGRTARPRAAGKAATASAKRATTRKSKA